MIYKELTIVLVKKISFSDRSMKKTLLCQIFTDFLKANSFKSLFGQEKFRGHNIPQGNILYQNIYLYKT